MMERLLIQKIENLIPILIENKIVNVEEKILYYQYNQKGEMCWLQKITL